MKNWIDMVKKERVDWLSGLLLNSERLFWGSTPRRSPKNRMILTSHLYLLLLSLNDSLVAYLSSLTNQQCESNRQWRFEKKSQDKEKMHVGFWVTEQFRWWNKKLALKNVEWNVIKIDFHKNGINEFFYSYFI